MAIKKIEIRPPDGNYADVLYPRTSIDMVDSLQTTLDAKVPTTRTVNGKALSANISLTASDVGASATGHTHAIANLTDLRIYNGKLQYLFGGTWSGAGGGMTDDVTGASWEMKISNGLVFLERVGS